MTIKEARKQLWLFLLLCFSLTGIIMFCMNRLDPTMMDVKAQALYGIACFCPAVSAFIIGLFYRVSPRDYKLLPHFEGNAKVYAGAILFAAGITLIGDPLTAFFFPEVMHFENVDLIFLFFHILLMVMYACVLFFPILGEELGWLGFMFSRLETLHGTISAVILMGIIRGLWHIPLFLAGDGKDVVETIGMLILSNIFLGSVLVYVTKKSDSIIPASLIHSINNGLAGVYGTCLVINPDMMEKFHTQIQIVSILPVIFFGVIGYVLLVKWKKK